MRGSGVRIPLAAPLPCGPFRTHGFVGAHAADDPYAVVDRRAVDRRGRSLVRRASGVMIQRRPRGGTPGLIHRIRRTEPARIHVDDLTIAVAHTTARFGESRI